MSADHRAGRRGEMVTGAEAGAEAGAGASADRPRAPARPPARPPARVLVVDDNRQNLLAFEALLEPLGEDVVRASDAEEALERLAAAEFAVALVDVQMPGMDGIELARRLRERAAADPDLPALPPIIFVTARDRDHRHVVEAYAAGAVDFLYKPVDPDVLRAKVATFVELYRRRDAAAFAERLQAQQIALQQQSDEARALAEELEHTNERLRQTAAAAESARADAETLGLRLLATLESIRDGFFTLDRQCRVTFANEGALGLWRLTRPEVLGRVLWDLVPEARDTPFRAEVERALAEGTIAEHEDYFALLDRWLVMRAYPTPEGAAVHLRDISARRRAEEAQRQSEERYRTLIEVTAQVVWTADGAGMMDVMPSWCALTGQAPDEARGVGWLDAVHPDDRPRVAELWRRSVETRVPLTTAYRLRMADGSYRWFGVRGAPVLDPDGGVREWVGTCSDIDERMRAEDARDFFARASDALGTSLSVQAVLATVAELAVSRLADGCVIRLLRADGSFERAAVAGRDARKVALLADLDDRGVLPREAPTSHVRVVRTGRSAVAGPGAFTPAALGPLVRDADALAEVLRLEVYSVMTLPIPARGHPVGALTLVLYGPGRRRPFEASDLVLAEELARRAGLALENTQLYEAEQEARQLAERAAARTARLQQLTARLAEAVTPDEAARAVVEQGVAALGAAAGLVALLTPAGDALEVAHASGYHDGTAARRPRPRVPLDARVPIADAARSGEPVAIASADDLRARYPALAGAAVEFPASISVPLAAEGQVLGVLALSFAGTGSLGPDDGAFLRAVAQQCAQALRRASLYAAEAAARREAEAAERRLAFIAEASAVLGSSLDYAATLRSAAQLAVPVLADYCLVDLLDDSGQMHRLAEAHADPAMGQLLRGTARYYPRAGDERNPLRAAIEAGETRVVPEITDEWLQLVARSPEHLADLRTLAPRSAVMVPMAARGRAFGLITFAAAGSRRHYGPADVSLAEELTRRAAAAVDHARLFADAQLARRDAEAASRAKTDFLATMSHELRTPLNAIAGYVDLMEMGIRGPITDQQREDLARVKRNQEHLLALINDVLDVAKLEAGRVELRPEAVAMADVLDGVQPLVAPQVQAKGVAYDYRRPDAAIAARADRDRLRQIVVNLLSNAVKFTEPGGHVTLTCEAAHNGDGGLVAVRVADTGRGIPSAKLEAIFEPFVQVESVLTRTQGGTGLGLAISRDLARRMGGDLTVESEVGVGSTFTLTLPRE